MLKILQARQSQGRQYIADLRSAVPQGFVGRPRIDASPCDSCSACADACPTHAITVNPVTLDMGRCVFCRECVAACPGGKIQFTQDTHSAAIARDDLVVRAVDTVPAPVAVSTALHDLFGRSLKLRSVSTGGCNACELELNALGNVNFDMGRYGIEFVASPRHADALVLSGPLTAPMSGALRECWQAMPQPRFVIAFGACAISGGLYADSPVLDRSFLAVNVPLLHLPGCPPHPLTFINGILELLGIKG